MRTTSLCLLLGLTIQLPAVAQSDAPSAASAPPPGAETPQTDGKARKPDPAEPRAAPPPRVIFRPSETISEDTAVPFPADI
ncbi:MAG: hypothetical protein CMK33_03860 [Porticoccaceae bacterium]|nr:hypothetical protein [Porticoccaceae bacterium]